MIALAAPIASVTVLEDRAAVTRRGRLAVAAGQHRLVIERVSPVLADKTLTATATGARVLDVRCERSLAPWRAPGREAGAVAALHAERVRLETARDAALARRDTARAELAALAALTAAALRDLAIAAGRAIPAPGAAEQLAALDAADAAARARAVTADLDAIDLTAQLGRLAERIARAEACAGEQVARLVIDLVSDAAAEVGLVIGYVVPGAAWRPYHRAVIVRNPDSSPPALASTSASASDSVEWQTTACVWQATGEDWDGAELVFSLERPSLGTAPPALADDELRARRRPETVLIETREHEHHTAGLGGASGAEVPGIDDGGLGLRLVAAKATIAADGAPHRVPVGGFTAAVALDRVAIPLRSPWVHLRAQLSNTGAVAVLAGPVDLVMASGYVGRTEISFVAPGEQLQLGFGPDADLRVHRSETSERDDAGLLGGWNVQTVRVAVRLSNLGGAPREVVVTERVPISEIEQVEVQVAAPEAYRLPAEGEPVPEITERTIDARGLVSWTVALPPHGRRAVTLEYRIRSQRGVAGV